MRVLRLAVVVLVSAVAFQYGLGSRVAHGDVYNPQFMPLGERQAFMGNTGTGDASDSGAVYYNPAGLADLGRDKVSVNGSAYLNYQIKYANLETVNGALVPYEASGLNTIPSTFVTTLRHWGFNFALSVLVPESISVENRSAIRGGGGVGAMDGQLVQSSSINDLRVGFTIARKITDHFNLGITLALNDHTEAQVLSIIVHVPSATNTVSIATRSIALTSYALVPTLGAKWVATDWLSVGARVQLPTVQFSGSANTFSSTDSTVAGTVSNTDREDRPNGDATYKLPLDSTLGVAFTPASWFELLADVSFQTGVDYTHVQNSVWTNRILTDATLRYNLGVQFNLSTAWSVLAGGYYNPSAIHSLNDDHIGDTQLDYWGASLGAIWSVEHVQTGLGAIYFTGSGLHRASDRTNSSASVTGLGVLLTTAYVF